MLRLSFLHYQRRKFTFGLKRLILTLEVLPEKYQRPSRFKAKALILMVGATGPEPVTR